MNEIIQSGTPDVASSRPAEGSPPWVAHILNGPREE